MVDKEILMMSKANLASLLEKTKKYKVVRPEAEVEMVLKGLSLFHCTRQTNIMTVLKEGEIKVKNLIGVGELSNNENDYYQGFDKHISLSVGKPWPMFGNFVFVFGIEHISETSLFYYEDPWLFNGNKLMKSFLIKEDFLTLARELISKNLVWYSSKIIKKNIFIKNSHKLAKYNFRKFELKQDQNLNLQDSDEFLVWTQLSDTIYTIVNVFGTPRLLIPIVIIIISMFGLRMMGTI